MIIFKIIFNLIKIKIKTNKNNKLVKFNLIKNLNKREIIINQIN